MFPGLEVQETKILNKDSHKRTLEPFSSLERQFNRGSIQHPTSKEPSFRRTTQKSLRGPKLGPQSWLALEFWGCVEVQKAKTKKINLSKEIKEVS